MKATSSEQYKRLLEYRKAERDALFLKHGEGWRKYLKHPGTYWSDKAQDDDERKFMEAKLDA